MGAGQCEDVRTWQWPK